MNSEQLREQIHTELSKIAQEQAWRHPTHQLESRYRYLEILIDLEASTAMTERFISRQPGQGRLA